MNFKNEELDYLKKLVRSDVKGMEDKGHKIDTTTHRLMLQFRRGVLRKLEHNLR